MQQAIQPARRAFQRLALAAAFCAVRPAQAQAAISQTDAASAVRAALEKGALAAVAQLGHPDGFLGNPRLRIPLPGQLEEVARLMRSFGQGQKVDELQTAINRAAEAAVPAGRDVLLDAVRQISVADARQILSGGDSSVTDFFAARTRAPLIERFLPVVAQATEKVSLAQRYNDFAGRAARFGLLKPEDANLQQYVAGKTLDALYLVIADEERRIRSHPLEAGSQILQKVFGALR